MPMTSDELDAIATQPNKVKTDAGEVTAPTASEVIAIDQYSASKASIDASPRRGLRFTRLNPGSAVGS